MTTDATTPQKGKRPRLTTRTPHEITRLLVDWAGGDAAALAGDFINEPALDLAATLLTDDTAPLLQKENDGGKRGGGQDARRRVGGDDARKSDARQISHHHVCRVYDVGESGGQHFLSMEYVRGEELSSLLKRIGRLPPDKAAEIARQLCAGLTRFTRRACSTATSSPPT